MRTFTEQEIEIIKAKGFKQEEGKHSGLFFIEDDDTPLVTIIVPAVILPGEDVYKLEFYEYYEEEGYSKEYSSPGQDLKSFLDFWI